VPYAPAMPMAAMSPAAAIPSDILNCRVLAGRRSCAIRRAAQRRSSGWRADRRECESPDHPTHPMLKFHSCLLVACGEARPCLTGKPFPGLGNLTLMRGQAFLQTSRTRPAQSPDGADDAARCRLSCASRRVM
jgi:hypothetical protein